MIEITVKTKNATFPMDPTFFRESGAKRTCFQPIAQKGHVPKKRAQNGLFTRS